MNIFKKSIKISTEMFLIARETVDQPQFHFSFLFRKNRLISSGMNNYKLDNKAFYFANRFNIIDKKNYPTIHSEISAISKIWGKYNINHKLRLINVRFTKAGLISVAKPCKDCKIVLDSLGIQEVYWTLSCSTVTCYTGKTVTF